MTKKQSLLSYTYFENDLTGWNLLSPETIVAQENCGNNWIIYIRTVVQFETVPSTESMLLEDFVMSIPIFKGNKIITKLKSVNVTEIWSLVTIQEHQHLTRTLSLTTQTLHKDSTFRKKDILKPTFSLEAIHSNAWKLWVKPVLSTLYNLSKKNFWHLSLEPEPSIDTSYS